MKYSTRILVAFALFPLLAGFAGCEERPPTPGPGARSPTTGGDSNTQDGSSVTGQTPGNRGGTPGGAAPGATPTNP